MGVGRGMDFGECCQFLVAATCWEEVRYPMLPGTSRRIKRDDLTIGWCESMPMEANFGTKPTGEAVMTATCFEMDAHAGQMMLFVETAGKNDSGDAPSSDTDVGGGGVQGTHTEMVERAQRAKLPPTAQIEYRSWMRQCEGASMLIWERMWQLRRPVVDIAPGYGIAAGDGIVAARGSATACGITEECLAPQVQVLRERVLGSAALVDFVGICDDEYCGEARQCGGESAPAGRVARRLHHRPSGTVRHGARHMEVAVGTPAHHKTLFGYASIGVSACERGWRGGRVSAWSVGGEHWVGIPNGVQQLQTAN